MSDYRFNSLFNGKFNHEKYITMGADGIQKQLRERGYNFSRIANVLDVSVAMVSYVASRQRHSLRVATAIATALDLPIEKVFPDVPEYHRNYPTAQEREQALATKLQRLNLIRRTA